MLSSADFGTYRLPMLSQLELRLPCIAFGDESFSASSVNSAIYIRVNWLSIVVPYLAFSMDPAIANQAHLSDIFAIPPNFTCHISRGYCPDPSP